MNQEFLRGNARKNLEDIGRRKKLDFLEDSKLVATVDEKNLLKVWINQPAI